MRLDARALGKKFERLAELDLVIVHHEVDRVAARTTSETLVETLGAESRLVGDDRHRWRLVIVKRAEPHAFAALRTQRDDFSDDRQQVGRRENTVAIIVGVGASHWLELSEKQEVRSNNFDDGPDEARHRSRHHLIRNCYETDA